MVLRGGGSGSLRPPLTQAVGQIGEMMSDFKKEGSIAWYFGMLLCGIGFAFMFEKDELDTVKKAFEWIKENLPNTASTRQGRA